MEIKIPHNTLYNVTSPAGMPVSPFSHNRYKAITYYTPLKIIS